MGSNPIRRTKQFRVTGPKVGYIEARGAVVGKLVELLDLGGLWKVDRVSNGVTKAFVREQERAFKVFQGSISKGGGQIDA